jgi:hypothetical protein
MVKEEKHLFSVDIEFVPKTIMAKSFTEARGIINGLIGLYEVDNEGEIIDNDKAECKYTLKDLIGSKVYKIQSNENDNEIIFWSLLGNIDADEVILEERTIDKEFIENEMNETDDEVLVDEFRKLANQE